MTPQPIAVYGGGGCGRETAWLIDSHNQPETKYHLTCFIDDDPLLRGKLIQNLPTLGLEEAANRFPGIRIISGIGDPPIRQRTMNEAAAMGFGTAVIVHPRAELSPSVIIGPGTWIAAGSVLSTDVVLGLHVQINPQCHLGHDVVVGDYTTLASRVLIPGRVIFEERVRVGPGAIFLKGKRDNPITVGSDAVIGAGAHVTDSVPQGGRWEGDRLSTPPSPPYILESKEWMFPEIQEGKPTRYTWLVQHLHNLQLGYLTDIGAFTYINAKYGVTIEDRVQVGSHCSIYSISTIDEKKGPVRLQKNCRVGSHSVIMPGVTIGANAIVGACSLVNTDIPANVVAFGIPAKIIKHLD